MLHNTQKDTWEKRYKASLDRLRGMLAEDYPSHMVESEARLLLEASYGGPWRLILALVEVAGATQIGV